MSNKQKAILLMVVSTLSFSFMQLIVKIAGPDIPTMEKVFFRNFITLFLGLFLVFKDKAPIFGKKENRLALLCRSVFGFIGVAGYFYATNNMNVADASLLHRSSPFFVIIFSAIFLRNRLTRVQISARLLAFVGSVLVINPSFNVNVLPALVGLISAAGAGGAYVIINYLKGKESNSTIVFCFSLVSCTLSALMSGSDFIMPNGIQWVMLLGIGIFAGIGRIALTQAYKMTNPGEVSIINYLGIIFSAILGFVFLNERISTRSFIGIALILTAALLLYFMKNSKEIGRSKAA